LEVSGNAFTLKNIQKHAGYLSRICTEIAGRSIELEIESNDEEAAARQKKKEISGRLKQEAMSDPFLMEAIEVFDGRVVDIKVP
jgi:DNA polymerase-3 subunit gamma/tau